MYEEHPAFIRPPHDALLWRYVDFTKFVSLLDKRALFFSRADHLGDPFEGSYPKTNIALQIAHFEAAGLENPAGVVSQIGNINREVRETIVINCWHERAHESAAMWKLYAREKDGIAIKTAFKNLADSFTTEEAILIGRVKYIDYDTEVISVDTSHLKITSDLGLVFALTFRPYLVKRKSFEHEREIRVMTFGVVSWDEGDAH